MTVSPAPEDTAPTRPVALAAAVAAGEHDAVLITGPGRIGPAPALAEAVAATIRDHGARLVLTSGEDITDPEALTRQHPAGNRA